MAGEDMMAEPAPVSGGGKNLRVFVHISADQEKEKSTGSGAQLHLWRPIYL